MKQKIFTVLCTVMLVCFVFGIADVQAASKNSAWDLSRETVRSEGAFTYHAYTSKNGKEAWIYKISFKKGKKSGSLSIPKTLDGKKVTRLGAPEDKTLDAYVTLFGSYAEPWHNADGACPEADGLRTIRIPDTVKVIDPCAFSGLDLVLTIKLPKKVEELGAYTFYGCDSLKKVILPDGLKKFNNTALKDCPKLSTLKIAAKNKNYRVKGDCLIRKKDKTLVYVMPTGKALEIPAGTKAIESFAFNNATSPTVHIPSSVTKIERMAFCKEGLRENIHIKDVTVAEENPVYAKDGQCIYNKTDKSLSVAIPDDNGVLYLSGQIETLTPDYSVVNCDTAEVDKLEKVVLPANLKKVTVPGFSRVTQARNVYFTGAVPPEVTKPKSAKGYAKLPIFCNVYVPEAYADTYKAWYKKNKGYSFVDSWNTYDPAAMQ